MSLVSPQYDSRQRYEVKAFDLVYREADGESWLVRIYQPVGDGPFPAVLDFHGGAWSEGNRFINATLDEDLASTGVVVAAFDFRLAPRDPYPASIQDTNYATRWLKSHAAEFGADPSTVGAIGASSGAHMAILSAMRPRDSRYAALPLSEATLDVDGSLHYVIALWPIVDPHARYLFAQETCRDDLIRASEGFFVDEATMRQANPYCILERGEKVDLPPILVLQGTADTHIHFDTVVRFANIYRDRGGRCELEIFPGSPHRFAHTPGPDADRTSRLVKVFLERELAAAPERS